ncbi:monocarboxylate uptake permease MctP [uncultured Hyphomicrobium sp.]|uniref:monocarboxylate uptake permease MctP n=1 Tax=uncultured Hyphomicrobium sp. TaxID=194373 RepID=UPI0025DF2F40|nr:sodium:solute symporter family protein [uncultured Hyphomicrobium sp.]
MIEQLNWTATYVFLAFFALVTILGFIASRWRRADLDLLHEWGLGGRRFGPWVSWFLIGGDLYTAYTVIAVPALVYAVGAYGFFAIPYTIIIYPFLFLVFPRMWNVTHKRGYITAGDFVFGRYGNRWLELAIAATGILATMPYIALQLVGIEKVIHALGFQDDGLMGHVPLTIAFVILALYTYTSGLRAPAMIAFVKDIMIYVFVLAAIIIIPAELGGYEKIFDTAAAAYAAKGGTAGLTLTNAQIIPYITVALGSAMALFIYPHSLTGILSASSGDAIKRNAIALPAFSVVLGLVGLLGVMAHAAGVNVSNPQDVVPQLVLKMFPDWFVGFCFAAIAIGALVPAAVMSIGAANTFTRNIWKPFVHQEMSAREETILAKLTSLVVKLGALLVIFFVPTKFAIDFQLLGGMWMIQCFPAIIFGLYTRWFTGWSLLAGWAVGMAVGTYLAWGPVSWTPTHAVFDWFLAYNGIIAVGLNIVVAVMVTLLAPVAAPDETEPADYIGDSCAGKAVGA